MGKIVYLRLKNKVEAKLHQTIKLGDIALVSAEDEIRKKLMNTELYEIKKEDRNIVIIDVFRVIHQLSQRYTNLEFQQVGPNQTIINIQKPKKTSSMVFVTLIWLLLYIGAAMAIMNFHYDVSMEEVQQRLHYLLTGEEVKHPLWIQVPYSIGLGVGMILFFNHLFKKRINEEPSPLEVEMFKYQQDLDQYVILHENKLVKDQSKDDTSNS
ncbi:stage V sporulation protein AA [Pontibacillus marinus]|uniref:Stage V sporulation protein AA n=1 Tax=Pontibacillus marinus BH030004 = DSM 16465 TaxID=1385511 RepID=A0A0A5FVW8_9BACI|nr:stage V sporulation protein AA [Pontibacillus marinus]KGX83163.1 stage V sporulation protein AA [Pontibacillus marinus BH030004 = DSM 16465]